MKSLKPITEEEKTLAATPRGMRVLMMRHARHSALVRAVDTAATMFRMNELDRYTTLAFNALRQVEELEAKLLEMQLNRPLVVQVEGTQCQLNPSAPRGTGG